MRNIILIGVVFIATSCSFIQGEDKDLIERDVFVDILVDIHFADAIITEKGYRITNDSLRISKYYDDVLKKHNVSRKKLDKTIEYYTKNSNDYKHVYDDVIIKLNVMKEEFDVGEENR